MLFLLTTLCSFDDEAPILNCPNISSTTDEGLNSSSTVLLSSTATDNVDFHLDVICSHSSEYIFLIGDTTVNCSSSDAAGNTETCLLVVTVSDDEAPILNCPNISSTTDEGLNSSSTVLLSSTATDNVDFHLDVICSHSSEYIFLIGDTTVNCSSSDAAGNTDTCLLVVTVTDDEAPILNCLNISSTTDEGLNSSSTVLLSSTATDNVDSDLDVNCSHSSEDIFLIGDTTVNCSSLNAAGNTETCLLVVTVTGVNMSILYV
ncbi:hyalin-like [Strongylocentrotus purpuratus]|uniref:HYR domain-containing protein n=1 Tax=Strongylocentrotus purpuratus TaxID=7668 RepID=A0A7M7PHL3_STRPU|nr:hyalin-like [Strongylocentrotus purpuratus]